MEAKRIAREMIELAKSIDDADEMKETWRVLSRAYSYVSQKDSMMESEHELQELQVMTNDTQGTTMALESAQVTSLLA